ncbi:MAG: formylglycine-generating enzyme family protein [Paludibacteraceae bacterium]|nr:formylglycine-generating enzyme family protein [Paludibacteraceae bacterium]
MKSLLIILSVLTFEVNGVTFQLNEVEGGTFIMGATEEQGSEEEISIDKPVHSVAVQSFYLGQTEVTNRLWNAVMVAPATPIKAIGDRQQATDNEMQGEIWAAADCPVVLHSWFECQEFIRRLDSITGIDFRLPHEAEWEYAARGGKKGKTTRYAGSDNADEVSWLYRNSGNRSHAVAQKKPNELGLYDMTGNVWEWCLNDFYPYQSSPEVISVLKEAADTAKVLKVMRGGSWDNAISNSHLSVRRTEYPQYAFHDCGLRLALSKKIEPTVLPQTKKVRIKGYTMNFNLVMPQDSINPYYLAEEDVSAALWKAVMRKKMYKVSKEEVQSFLYQISDKTGYQFSLVPSNEQVTDFYFDEEIDKKNVKVSKRKSIKKANVLLELFTGRENTIDEPTDYTLLRYKQETPRTIRLIIIP